MTKKRTRQSTRRQAKKLEIALTQSAIFNPLGRDIDQYLGEQRQLAALDREIGDGIDMHVEPVSGRFSHHRFKLGADTHGEQLANCPKRRELVEAAAEAAEIPERSLIAADALGLVTKKRELLS